MVTLLTYVLAPEIDQNLDDFDDRVAPFGHDFACFFRMDDVEHFRTGDHSIDYQGVSVEVEIVQLVVQKGFTYPLFQVSAPISIFGGFGVIILFFDFIINVIQLEQNIRIQGF